MAPTIITENFKESVKPITDAMEPYKVHESSKERGSPVTHEDLGKFRILLMFDFILF